MIYILALILPPLALLIDGKPFSALFNLVLIVLALILSIVTFFSFPWLLIVPSAHAIFVIAQARRRQEHRELVEAAREGRMRID